MKAEELKKSLEDLGFSEDHVTRLVQARVEEGTVEVADNESDEVVKSIDPAVLDEAVDALKKSLVAEPVEEQPAVVEMQEAVEAIEDAPVAEEIAKGGEFDDAVIEKAAPVADNDVALKILAKGTDTIINRVDDQHRVLSSAVLALGKLVQDMAKSMNAEADTREHLVQRVDMLTKALNIPVPPKSLSKGVEAVPAPGEVDNSSGITYASVVAKAQEMMKNPDVQVSDAHQLVEAVSMLDTGADPAYVAAKYQIPVS